MVSKVLKFVERPEWDPVLDRLNLNDPAAGIYLGNDGVDLGTPEFLGEPGGVGAEHGYRDITISLRVVGSNDVAANVQNALAREFARQSNWLLYRVEDMAPLWFKTYQGSPGALNMRLVEQGVWDVTFTLKADPFGLGMMVRQTVTINNDPAAALNGMLATIGTIDGDYPAPAIINFPAGTSDYIRPYLSVFPLEWSSASTAFWWGAEGGGNPGNVVLNPTMGTNSAISATGQAGYSGGRYVYTSFNAAGTPIARRRMVTWNVTAPYAGRYKLFARIGHAGTTVTGVDYTVTGAGAACSVPKSTRNTWGGTAFAGIFELGTYTFPKGNLPTSKPYVLDLAQVGIDVEGFIANAQGGTGASQLTVDYVVGVPIDLPLDSSRGAAYTLNWRDEQKTRGNVVLRVDGENQMVSEIKSGKYDIGTGPEIPGGTYPMLTPGAKNMLTLITRRGQASTGGIDSISTSMTLTIDYYPRFVNVAVMPAGVTIP